MAWKRLDLILQDVIENAEIDAEAAAADRLPFTEMGGGHLVDPREFAVKAPSGSRVGVCRSICGHEPPQAEIGPPVADGSPEKATRGLNIDALGEPLPRISRAVLRILCSIDNPQICEPIIEPIAINVVNEVVGPNTGGKEPRKPVSLIRTTAKLNSDITLAVKSAGGEADHFLERRIFDPDESARGRVVREIVDDICGTGQGAANSHSDALSNEDAATQVDQAAVTGEGEECSMPGMRKRTRSADQWTIRQPGKGRVANRPASDIGVVNKEPSHADGGPILVPACMSVSRCLPSRPKRARPTLGDGNHLRIVPGRDHSGSPVS